MVIIVEVHLTEHRLRCIGRIDCVCGVVKVCRDACGTTSSYEEDVATVAVCTAQFVDAHWRNGAVIIVAAVVDNDIPGDPLRDILGILHFLKIRQLLTVGSHHLVANAGRLYAMPIYRRCNLIVCSLCAMCLKRGTADISQILFTIREKIVSCGSIIGCI